MWLGLVGPKVTRSYTVTSQVARGSRASAEHGAAVMQDCVSRKLDELVRRIDELQGRQKLRMNRALLNLVTAEALADGIFQRYG